MNTFTQITKRRFIDDMVKSPVIFISGGFTIKTLENPDFVESIIALCGNTDVGNSEHCRFRERSNFMERILPNGDVSRLDTYKANFYTYNNIYIVEKRGENGDRNNYVIYLSV